VCEGRKWGGNVRWKLDHPNPVENNNSSAELNF
jgi:hypothetical protein